ncbi:DNA translocase FtsK [Chromobacterium violaceum]|uniref:FtsK gamma domain-containing protein n=1 Tax=Chromobacterium violaceum TaxID=536 RepID=A0A202B572_CHRVL|nr:hypothetical protein CBW21_17635 [Chromobacterium violaceum]
MSLFTFEGRAEITHINTRKEGPDEDKVLAVDIKLTARAPAALISFFDEQLASVLYLDSGAVRNQMMEPIKFKHDVPDCELVIGRLQFMGAKVSKFQIEPVDGFQINLTWQNSFQPSGNDVAILSEYLKDEIDVYVAAQPDLFGQAQAGDGDGTGSSTTTTAGSGDEDDPLFSEACHLVMQSGKATISNVQRHLRIGYNRAARLIDSMEGIGIVSAMQSNGNREVLTTR